LLTNGLKRSHVHGVIPHDNPDSLSIHDYSATATATIDQAVSARGGTIDLSSLRGRPILLNFWASWCAACRVELPILERQYRTAWRDSLHVLTVSEDRGNRATVERFVKALGLRTLPIYLDPNGYVAHSGSDSSRNAPFALYGMPITYLIASSGMIIGYMPGAADWSSEAANGLIEYLRKT